MKYLILIGVTLVVSIILGLLGVEKAEMKVSGGFLVINIVLSVLGFIKAAELLGRYLE